MTPSVVQSVSIPPNTLPETRTATFGMGGLKAMLADVVVSQAFSGGFYVHLGHQPCEIGKGSLPASVVSFGGLNETQYLRRGYFEIDPFARRASRAFLPSRWILAELGKPDAEGLPFLRALEAYGAVAGVMVPIQDHAAGPAFVNFYGPQTVTECAAQDGRLMLAVCRLHVAARRIAPVSSSEVVLTVREIQILRLAAQGRTEPETAHLLALSRRGVQFHFARAMAKLDAPNKTAAVARAVSAGLIRI